MLKFNTLNELENDLKKLNKIMGKHVETYKEKENYYLIEYQDLKLKIIFFNINNFKNLLIQVSIESVSFIMNFDGFKEKLNIFVNLELNNIDDDIILMFNEVFFNQCFDSNNDESLNVKNIENNIISKLNVFSEVLEEKYNLKKLKQELKEKENKIKLIFESYIQDIEKIKNSSMKIEEKIEKLIELENNIMQHMIETSKFIFK